MAKTNRTHRVRLEQPGSPIDRLSNSRSPSPVTDDHDIFMMGSPDIDGEMGLYEDVNYDLPFHPSTTSADEVHKDKSTSGALNAIDRFVTAYYQAH